MNYKAIHPFPARMAPEIAFNVIKELPKSGVLLDPMMGSGTSLRVGLLNDHNCIGTDVDPLAILISLVANSYFNKEEVNKRLNGILEKIKDEEFNKLNYWDKETEDFAKFWFAERQIKELTILSKVVDEVKEIDLKQFFQVALSRCIITKDRGASLARDVSHAKPHRTKNENDYNVFQGFEDNVKTILTRTFEQKPEGTIQVFSDDVRSLKNVHNDTIDCIITSPPYLHAVDYFRGHRLSLVWFGYTLQALRNRRANSIGIQKNPEFSNPLLFNEVLTEVGTVNDLPANRLQHLYKYVGDCYLMCNEVHRVLKRRRKATIVIGDAYSSGVFINNTRLIKNAARISGLRLLNETKRAIPANKRYLPPPEYLTNSDLDKRMKTEAVLTFIK